jgi:hypothetical protein
MTPSPAAQLPEEPRREDFDACESISSAGEAYQRARAEWLEANLKVAVEALFRIDNQGVSALPAATRALSALTWKQP